MDNGGRKKTWSELKQVVVELRRQLSSLSTIVPSSVQFRNLKDGRTRIFFLSTPANGWETTLLYTDIIPDEPKVTQLYGSYYLSTFTSFCYVNNLLLLKIMEIICPTSWYAVGFSS